MTKTKYIAVALFTAFSLHAKAEVFGGIEFPQGASSFADEVISYDPLFSGGPAPIAAFSNPSDALGAPDRGEGPGANAVTLGHGGRIVLKFTNNVLTGSGTPAHDLHIFEVGSDVESMFVDISKDGVTWHSVGKVAGATSSIDIDAFGFTVSDHFQYVRLTDDVSQGGSTGNSPGADVDAVGAIASTQVPHTPTDLSIGRAVAVKWTSLMGSLYRIEESIDMTTWTVARDQIVGTGAELKEYFDAEDVRKFYRIVPIQ